MEFLIFWFGSGLAIAAYGILTDGTRKHYSKETYLLLLVCLIFGPLLIFALGSQMSDQKFTYGIPWYKQGPKMYLEYERHIDERDAFLKKFSNKNTSIKGTIFMDDGSNHPFERSYNSVIQCNIKNPSHLWECKEVTYEEAKHFFENEIAVCGFNVNSTHYPYHSIVCFVVNDESS